VHRIAGLLKARRQRRELLLTLWDRALLGVERRGNFTDLLDIVTKRRLLDADLSQTTVDAAG
jgi:hypothetical protein